MRANPKYRSQDKKFWANVRTIGQAIGYTDKQSKQVRIYSIDDLKQAMERSRLGTEHLVGEDGNLSSLAVNLLEYFVYRAGLLNDYVAPRLMDAERAEITFRKLYEQYQPTRPIPMNKQAGDKKKIAYLTGIVNMIIEAYSAGLPCDYDPHVLTTITKDHEPLRTLARRVDGCFPSCINPIAIWEIKEYYYTTTFGSRIADGVYETLLDGLELEELRNREKIHIEHLLIVDAYLTWWDMGKSYLCRMIDILNMGYVDEILFGYEVVERLPQIVQGWVKQYEDMKS
ncbi:MAG: hypothetical protein H6671_16845 [Anaerolineaceae bacterium]|nr:hypothetical protein [Anaerolineaceae bacterium]